MTATTPRHASRPENLQYNFNEYVMRHTQSRFALILAALLLAPILAPPPSARGEERTEVKEDLSRLGAAVLKLDSRELVRYLETGELSSNPRLGGDVIVAAWAIASAEDQPGAVEIIQDLIGNHASAKERTASLRDVFQDLAARDIQIDPAEVMPDTVLLAKQTRRSLLLSALRGDQEAVEDGRNTIAGDDLPAAMKQELSLFATSCRKLADQFDDSPLAAAIEQSERVRQKQDRLEVSVLRWLGDFRADPEGAEIPRGGQANAYTVMVEKEKARAALISAYSQLYTAYVNGQKTRIECIKGMQEIASESLDLKEKRAVMYWTLKKLRADHLKERREKSIAFSQKRSLERKQYTAADYSATWPSLFQHRELRDHADSLLANLADYSPDNSGPLSIVYARCVSDIRALNARLMSNLDGITIGQRAALRSYLRKLEIEIKQDYSSSGYIASLNTNRLLDTTTMLAERERSGRSLGTVQPAVLKLGGDDTDLASYALYRSILVSLLRAGQKGDKERLKALASVIRDTDLLNKAHKQSLNAIGSKLYTGTLKLDKTIIVEDPEMVLASIAGVSGDETGAVMEVPDRYRDQAFEVLIASAFDDPDV